MIGQPRGKVIVVGSHKGGIGRTAIAVNLAATLGLAGRRTLLVDLDPKGDATASVGHARVLEGRGVEHLFDPQHFLDAARPVEGAAGLDVWPGGPALEPIQAQLWRDASGDVSHGSVGGPHTELLSRGLALARTRYRVIMIDSLPALDPLGCNALAAADVLLLPLSRAAFSETALEETIGLAHRLCRTVRVVGVRMGIRPEEFLSGKPPELPGGQRAGAILLEAAIAHDANTLLAATERGVPVFQHAPGSRAARSFVELAREVIARIVDKPL